MKKLKEIMIKNKTIKVSKWNDDMFMFMLPKAEVVIHADKLKFTTNDPKNVTLMLYHSDCYVASIEIDSAKDRTAIEGLMAQ